MNHEPSSMTLSDEEHRLLGLWAADCAERVPPLFELEHRLRQLIALSNGIGWAYHGGTDAADSDGFPGDDAEHIAPADPRFGRAAEIYRSPAR